MAAQTVEKTTIPPPSMPATDPGRISGQVPMRPRQPTIPPGTLEELDEVYAARAAANFSPEQAIEAQITDLEAWACANLKRQRFDVTRFWVLADSEKTLRRIRSAEKITCCYQYICSGFYCFRGGFIIYSSVYPDIPGVYFSEFLNL